LTSKCVLERFETPIPQFPLSSADLTVEGIVLPENTWQIWDSADFLSVSADGNLIANF